MPDTRSAGRWTVVHRFVRSTSAALVLMLCLPEAFQFIMAQPLPHPTLRPIVLVRADDSAAHESTLSPHGSGVAPAGEDTLPANFAAPQTLKPLLSKMWTLSRTFRRQCARLRAEPSVRIRVYTAASLSQSGGRAATHIQRGPAGVVEAEVYLASFVHTSDFTELLAHEFEHIIEYLDGLDHARLARLAPATVWPTGRGQFETQRATETGRLVVAEVGRSDQGTPWVPGGLAVRQPLSPVCYSQLPRHRERDRARSPRSHNEACTPTTISVLPASAVTAAFWPSRHALAWFRPQPVHEAISMCSIS